MDLRAEALINELERFITFDPMNRQISEIRQPAELLLAARNLHEAKHVAVTTGFSCCPFDPPTETDGPAGAIALLRAALRSNRARSATLVIDEFHLHVMKECLQASDLSDDVSVFVFDSADQVEEFFQGKHLQEQEKKDKEIGVDHLIAVERNGPAKDGRNYTMFGRDITHLSAPISELFEYANSNSNGSHITTTGIGDGGNEIGMGKVLELVEKHIPYGKKIACVTSADANVVAGISNWGGYALACALFLLEYSEDDQTDKTQAQWISRMDDMLPTPESEREIFQSSENAGAHDGDYYDRKMSVDGMYLEGHVEILRKLREITSQIFNDNEFSI